MNIPSAFVGTRRRPPTRRWPIPPAATGCSLDGRATQWRRPAGLATPRSGSRPHPPLHQLRHRRHRPAEAAARPVAEGMEAGLASLARWTFSSAKSVGINGRNGNVTQITFTALNPSYPRTIKRNAKTFAGVTARTRTMTSTHRLSVIKAIALGATLSMTAGLALAGGQQGLGGSNPECVAAEEALTRGLSMGPQADRRRPPRKSISSIRCAPQHSVAVARRARGDRGARIDQAENRSRDSVRLQFGRHAGPRCLRCRNWARRSRTPHTSRVRPQSVAGHTDAIGGEDYNQGLSERRADTIKRYLTEKYGINGNDLVTVGYGETKPKDANAPMDPVNRRVQVVNMTSKTASK